MAYRVKEMVYTLQGEGVNVGRAVVLCRFEGCNLRCEFCDTDHRGVDGPGGGRFSCSSELAGSARRLWNRRPGQPWLLLTGGEPLLQVDTELVSSLHAVGFKLMLETNGTIQPPPGIDWTCVSPKAGSRMVLNRGDELKLVWPQKGLEPEEFLNMEFDHFLLQPRSGEEETRSRELVLQRCLSNPVWRFGCRIHRELGIP